MDGVAGAVDCVDNFLVCGRSALESLAILCLEEKGGVLVNACVTELEFSKAASVVSDVIEEMEFERA